MNATSIQIHKETHSKGLIGEIEFTLLFVRKGFSVYKPIDNNSRADLLIEKDGKFKKVQVKYCTPYKGCLRVELEHPGKNRKAYAIDDIDEIGVYDSVSKYCYLIPLKDILPRKEIWLRVEATSKNQIKNINLADKYKI